MAKEAAAELYLDLVKDAEAKTTWSDPKLSMAIKTRNEDGWNAHWGGQYFDFSFRAVDDFLSRSRIAARHQQWLRWFLAAALIALLILSLIAYYSGRQAYQKARELAALTVVNEGRKKELEKLHHSENALADRINSLNASQGATKEERDRIAKEKAALEAQLEKAQQDSQKLALQAQQQQTCWPA